MLKHTSKPIDEKAQALCDSINAKLQAAFGNAIEHAEVEYDFPVFTVSRDKIFEILKFLKEDKELDYHFLTTMCGLHFTHIRAEERIRLGGVVAGLLRSQHDASVPEGPRLAAGRFRYLRSADVWLAVAFLGFLALVLATLIPWFSLCTWGVNC